MQTIQREITPFLDQNVYFPPSQIKITKINMIMKYCVHVGYVESQCHYKELSSCIFQVSYSYFQSLILQYLLI